MVDKKEVQRTIVPQENTNGKVSEDEFFQVLKMVAPGTNFRSALDGALKAGKGALIVVENQNVPELLDGGFKLHCRFTPQRLVELTKMDGAIVLSSDLKKITYSNVLLTPDSKIPTAETGTRHKAAERTAKQTSTLVIAISERKHEINLFYKNVKYLIKGTEEILRKANEHIQLLEKQRELFDKNLQRLNQFELRNYPSLNQASQVIQKGRIIQKIAKDVKKYSIELGNEGTLLKTRLNELLLGVEKETNLVIQDYTQLDLKKSRAILDAFTYEEIADTSNILRALAYDNPTTTTTVKGWRILSKTSLPEAEIAMILKEMGSLGKTIHSSTSTYEKILGEEKGNIFKNEIERIKLSI